MPAQEMSVSLYGEVQKEVIEATLASDFGIDVTFRETTTIYVERPVGTRRRGRAPASRRRIRSPPPSGCASTLRRSIPGVAVPTRRRLPRRSRCTSTRRVDSFVEAMTEVRPRTRSQEGLFGWRVTDCVVTMTECGYYVGDGPAKPQGRRRARPPPTSAADADGADASARAVRDEGLRADPRVGIEIPTEMWAPFSAHLHDWAEPWKPSRYTRTSPRSRRCCLPTRRAGPSTRATRPHRRRGDRRNDLRQRPACARCRTDARRTTANRSFASST